MWSGGATPTDLRGALCVNAGTAHVVRGDLDAGARLLSRALQVQPDSAPALRAMAQLELVRGNHAGALEVLKRRRVPQTAGK